MLIRKLSCEEFGEFMPVSEDVFRIIGVGLQASKDYDTGDKLTNDAVDTSWCQGHWQSHLSEMYGDGSETGGKLPQCHWRRR